MNKKIGILLILILLCSNVLLLFLYFNKHSKGKGGRQKMLERFKTEVGLTDVQVKQFETLREAQREANKPLMDSIINLRKAYIGVIFAKQPIDSIKRQYSIQLAAKMLQLDIVMHRQLMEAKKICTPNQYAAYDSVVMKMMTRIPDRKGSDKNN